MAEPSTALEVPTEPAARAEWRKTGILHPDPPKTEAPATSPKESSESTKDESASASEAGTEIQEQGTKPKAKGKLSAEDRIAQLESTIQKIRNGAGLGEPRTPTAASSTAQPAAPAALVEPKEPNPNAFKDWDSWDKANRQWQKDYSAFASKKAAAEAVADYQRTEAARAQQRALNTELEAGRKRYPDLDEVIKPVSTAIFNDQQIPPAVKAMIDESPVLVDLLYVMGSDAGELEKFVALARTNPAAALRKVVVLEQLVSEELSGKKSIPTVPAPKKITSAPGPTHEVSAISTAPADEVGSAVQSDNFQAYRRLANERDLKAQRRR
jgi:hypothetical protein